MDKKGLIQRFSEALTISDDTARQLAYLDMHRKFNKQKKTDEDELKVNIQKGGRKF